MAEHESAPVRHVRRLISRGYEPGTRWWRPVRFLLPDGRLVDQLDRDDILGWEPRPAGGETRLAFILPTHLHRHDAAGHRAWLQTVLAQLGQVPQAVPGTKVIVLLGMQWMHADDEAEAMRRLRELTDLAATRSAVHLLGMSLPGPGKASTLNAGIAVADQLGLTAVGWLDDDVLLEPDCLPNLVRDFQAHGYRGAVGATKVAHARPYVTSRLLHRAKALTATATNYPHGCCILVERSVVSGGLPDRYVCDDGYVCFRLLDPTQVDALHHLRLVPDARCHYGVAGPAGQSRRRIRRLLLNHIIYLADWDYPVSRHYFRQILFSGMWPLTDFDGAAGRRRGAAKSAVKWIYFAWFARTAAELYFRGLFRRPLREVPWAEYAGAGTPEPSPRQPSTEAPA